MSINWELVDLNTKIRIAFYGRVSTEHEAQLAALKNQIQWYYDQLERNPNWELAAPVEYYLDRGITGTQAKKRPGFLKIIEDAKSGKFDMIVTRDVSRFARNTSEALDYVQKLKNIDVQVYFINDGIKTIQDNDSDMKLTLMAMLAQEESKKISERAKAGQYISRNNGVLYGTGNILGYTRIRKRSDKDKRNAIGDKSVPTFAIVPEEAETVRLIFNWYAEGLGIKQIKTRLLAEGRKNSSGAVKWHESSISKLLSNPMYIGKQHQCQTEVVNYLAHKVKKNTEEKFVLIEGDFEPIISEELFNKVQEIKKQRQVKKSSDGGVYGCRASNDKWIPRLECGCGSRFQQYHWRTNASTGEVVKGYACRHRIVDGSAEFRKKNGIPIDDACSIPSIPAWKFDFMALKIFSEIWNDKKDCVIDVYSYLIKYYKADSDNPESRMNDIKKSIQRLKRMQDSLIDLYTDDVLSKEEFKRKKEEYESKIKTLKVEFDKLDSASKTGKCTEERLKDIKKTLESLVDYSGEWIDENVVINYVDKVVMRTATEFEWYINLHGDAIKFMNEHDVKRHNEPYEVKAQKTLSLQREFYNLAFTFCINFDEARAFKKSFGKFLRTNQWKDIEVKVYVRY